MWVMPELHAIFVLVWGNKTENKICMYKHVQQIIFKTCWHLDFIKQANYWIINVRRKKLKWREISGEEAKIWGRRYCRPKYILSLALEQCGLAAHSWQFSWDPIQRSNDQDPSQVTGFYQNMCVFSEQNQIITKWLLLFTLYCTSGNIHAGFNFTLFMLYWDAWK